MNIKESDLSWPKALLKSSGERVNEKSAIQFSITSQPVTVPGHFPALVKKNVGTSKLTAAKSFS